MKVTYSKQFEKDLKKYPKLKHQVADIIQHFKKATSVNQLPNIKKLKSDGYDFRLRIGNYRIGFSVLNETVVFRRFLHRKDIYKYFP